MTTAFIEALSERVALEPIETRVLEASGVASYDALFDLVTSFPSLATTGMDLSKLSSIAALESSMTTVQLSDFAKQVPILDAAGAQYPVGAPSPPGTEIPVPVLPARPALKMFGAAGPTFQSGIGTSTATPVTGGPIDVRGGTWPVHHQGLRGTCVAFAVAACRERSLKSSRLSEQFFYWAIKRRTNDPKPNDDGTYLLHAQEAMHRLGICDTPYWPYNPNPNQKDVTYEALPTAPSVNACADAITRKHAATLPVIALGDGAQVLWDALDSSQLPVAVSLPVFAAPGSNFHNWNTPLATARGAVSDPFPTSWCVSGHAVCVTGFVPDENEPHGGYFVFRNSWGPNWGANLPAAGYHAPEQGYGQISATYVAKHLWELLSM